jgi:putative acetyltransferase
LVEIGVDDPNAEDVRELLRRHMEFARDNTPPEDVHALEVNQLVDPGVTFYSYRRDGELLAVGALKQLDGRHAELKSMHTAAEARRSGVEHLIGAARDHGFRRVSLETGSTQAFAAARSLYAQAGFTPCGPFGDYPPGRGNTFMTLPL